MTKSVEHRVQKVARRTGGPDAEPDGTPRRYYSELLAAWCGPAAVTFFAVGFIGGRFIPPASPASSAAEVVNYWNHDLDARRFGVICFCIASTLFVPFAAAIAAQLRRIEGPGSPLAATQVGCAAVAAALGTAYSMMMMAILFRLDRPPEITQALNDLAWIPFVGVWQPTTVQALVLGAGILMDRRTGSVLPRPLGYFSIWYGLAAATGGLTGFFHGGPFAWNGPIAFYLDATLFFFWFVPVFWLLRRRILAESIERATL
jgi:hypothetical protein